VMEFKKATLQEVSSRPSLTPQVEGTPIEVQINPATLRLQMANNVDMGKAFARPNTQYQGTSSSTLSFDLVFDTADDGTTDTPSDVRKLTRQLERFLLPKTDQRKAVPPRVKFTYGTLEVVGVMSALNQEFDYFAPNGVPLRAKCAVTIKEQKPEFDANRVGPGANKGLGAQPALPPRGAGGVPSRPPADRTGTALDGESASDFANRMGLDPRAWKGLAEGLTDPLHLEAGLQIDFSASLSLDAGIGIEMGVTAGLGAPGAGGRGGKAPATPVPAKAPATGTALTAMGGLTRALDRATAARAGEAATRTATAFQSESLPGAPPPRAVAPPPLPAASLGASAPSAEAAPVTVDPRAITFGFGVPLRERIGVLGPTVVGLVHERQRGVAPAPDGVPSTRDLTVPAWQALPAGSVSGERPECCGHSAGVRSGCGYGGR
jgi:Contractile injection system tube protein